MNVPAGVWHTDRNLGDKDVVIVKLPTIAYDDSAPTSTASRSTTT